MKYSRTAIGLLTAQYRSVLKKCLLINLGLYALGAVSATPANAIITITTGSELDPYTGGVIDQGVYTGEADVAVTYTTPTSIQITEETAGQDALHIGKSGFTQSMDLGGANTSTIEISGNRQGIATYRGATLNVNSTDSIDVTSEAQEFITVNSESSSTINMSSKDINIEHEGPSHAQAAAVNSGANSGRGNGHINMDATNDITINSKSKGVRASDGGIVGLNAGNKISIAIDADGIVDYGAVWAQNNTTSATSDFATISLVAKEIDIQAKKANGIVAISQGHVNVEGNTTIDAEDYGKAIVARGNSVVNINQDNDENTTVIKGDIVFDKTNSSTIAADVNVNFAGAGSSWTGTTYADWKEGLTPSIEELSNIKANISLKDGATWTANRFDNQAEAFPGILAGSQYVGLNDLLIDNANVVINDDTNGIVTKNLVAKNANITQGAGVTKKLQVTTTADLRDGIKNDYSSVMELSDGAKVSVDVVGGAIDQFAGNKDQITVVGVQLDNLAATQDIDFGGYQLDTDAISKTVGAYYGSVTKDGNVLKLGSKNASASADLVGFLKNGNYIKAFDSTSEATMAETSVAGNLVALDTQVKTNADSILANADAIATNTANIAANTAALDNKLDTSAVIGTTGTASDSNVYSASAINTKLGDYLTSATASTTYQAKITSANPLSHELVSGLGSMATANAADYVSVASLDPVDPATNGLSINAKSLQVQGADVLTSHQAIAEGTENGTISVAGANVAVHGLGSAAFLDSDGAVASGETDLVTGGTVYNAIGRGTLTIKRSLNGATAENVGTFNANATADEELIIADSDTTYTPGDGITIDSSAGNKISVKTIADSGIRVNGDGVSVDKSVIQAKLTSDNAGDGIAYTTDESAGFKFSVDTASEGGLTFDDNGKLKVEKATTVAAAGTGLVTSGLLFDQKYLQNSETSKLALDTANVADLSVWNGDNRVAGININGNTSGTNPRTITMGVYDDSDTKSKITMNANGAYYSKSETMTPETDEIATLGTAAKGAFSASTNYADDTIGAAIKGKQATLNQGSNITLTPETDGTVTISARDTTYSAGDGITIGDGNAIAVGLSANSGLQFDDPATAGNPKTLSVKTDNATITKDAAGAIKVGTIGFGNIDEDNIEDGAAPSTKLTTKSYVDESLTSGLATKANLAGGNQFTGAQQFGVPNGTGFKTKAVIGGDGSARFGRNDANTQYAFVVQKDGITANQSIAAKQGITFGSGAYSIGANGAATLGATTVSSLTMGANTAASITPATGETTGLSLATANYAVEQAKAAADNAIQVSGDNISFYNSSSTTTPEATTYTADAIGTGYSSTNTVKADIASKQAQLYYMNGSTQTPMNAQVVTEIGTAGESATALDANLASELAVAKALATKQGNITPGNGLAWDASTDNQLNVKLKTFPTTGDTARPNGLALDADGLSVDLAANFVPNPTDYTDTDITDWVGVNPTTGEPTGTGNYFKIATVGQTYTVLGKKLLTVQHDLMDDNTNASSIARALVGAATGAAGTRDLPGAVQYLADGQIAAAATAGTGLAWTAATADAGAKLSVVEETISATAAPSAPTANHTFYDAKTVYDNFALKSDPSQTITAAEVDTKALKVANPLDSATPILEAKYNTTTQKNEITMNGATTVTGGLTADTASVTGNLTAGTFTLPDSTTGATAGDTVQISGIKKAVEANASDDSKNYLVTSDAVNSEFDTKVGTLTKENATTQGKYDTVSVADMIGVDANGEFKFDESLSNLYYGNGETSANFDPRTIRGAFVNLNSALGKIHGLAENSADGVKVNNTDSIFKNGNIDSAVTGVTTKVGSNLKVGTSVEDLEVSLDNAIGNIQAGNTVVGKAYADQFGNLIDTTYAKDADVVHKAGAETIDGVKTFSNGLKVGADWQVKQMGNSNKDISFRTVDNKPVFNIGSDGMLRAFDGTGSDKPFFTAAKDGLTMSNSNGKAYMNSTADSFSLYNSTSYNPTFSVENATGDLSASKGKFTVVTDTADDTKVKASVAGDIEATGNVQAAGLQLTSGPVATSIAASDVSSFPTAGADTTLATLQSINTLAEKATFTPADGGTLTKTTIGEAINELDSLKQAKLVNDKTPAEDISSTVKTTVAAAADASDTSLVTEKAIRTELDNITNGTTPFTGFTMINNATSSAENVTMTKIDDGTYNDESEKTFATNLTIKSAVDKLVFGGNPNIWTGVNEFQNDLLVTKSAGSGPRKVLFQVDTASGDTTIASLLLGSYETAMNGIDLMPTKNSVTHLVTSGGVYTAMHGDASNDVTIGDEADKTYIGGTKAKLTLSNGEKTAALQAETIILGKSDTDKVVVSGGDLSASGSVQVGADSKNSKMTNESVKVSEGTTYGEMTKNSITLHNSEGDVFTVGGDGSITAGKAGAAGQFALNTAAGTASINTSKAPAISAAIAADGDSAAMEATDGAYDYLISANADAASADNRGVVVGVTATGQDKMISGFEADNDSAGMGLGDATSGKMVAGLSVKKVDDTQNTVELGAFDNTNNKLDTGVSVDSKGKTVSIAAAGNEVVNVSYDTTKGKGLVGVTGDLTATGNFSADNAGFTVSHNDTTGKTDVVATGDVKAASLTLPNANATVGGTITATAIDNSATAFPATGADTTLATLQSINNLAGQASFTAGDQKSWRNPYAGDASTKPTTIAGALDRLATNLDAATNSLGDWSTLNAHVTASGYTGNGNITVTGTDPYKAPSAVSAVIDLDDAIGYRTLYNKSHYANTTNEKVSVSQAIASMDTAVYQDIHGTGTATAPAGHVKIGDNALTTTLGSGSYKVAVNSVQGQTVFGTGNPDKVVIKGGSIRADDAAGNQSYYKADGITVNGDKFTVDKDGNTVAAGSLTAAGGAFSVTPADATTDPQTPAQLTMNGNALITGNEDVTGDFTAANGNFAVRTADSGKTTATTIGDLEVQKAGATPTTMFKVDSEAGTVVVGDASAAHVTMDTTGKIESVGSTADKKVTIDQGDVVVSGNTKTATFEMPDAYQPTASSVQYAQVTSIDKGTTAANSFSDAALATTQSIKTKAENADYTASDALKAGNYATAQTSVATINNAIESLDLRIGDWDGLHLTPNGNLTNGHAGDSTYNEPTTVVEAFNNIDSTLGRIHGLVEKNNNGTYTYHTSSGDYTQDWTNLAVGTTVEEHVLAVDTAIGNRNGYTAAYNINRGESVAESLNNIDLRLGDVKSLNNMNYYGEQNPNDVNLTGAVRALDNNLYRVEHDLKTLRHDTYAGLASAAALSALVPNPRGTGDTTLSFGTGAYQGHTAAALGGFHWITNNLLVNAGVGWDNREATTRIGVSYSF